MDTFNVPQRLYYWARDRPQAEAFVFLGNDGSRDALTCKEIFDEAIHFARQLRKLKLKPGDIVCSLLPDSTPNGLIAFFGIIVAGCVVFNGKLQLRDGSFLIQNLNKTKCQAVIVSSDKNEPCHKLLSQLLEFKAGHAVSSKVLVHVDKLIFTKDDPEIGFNWMVPESQSNQIENCFGDFIHCDGNADAIILLSSGTTGMSKMIVHSHRVFEYQAKPFCKDSKSGAICYYPLNWGPGVPSYYMLTGLKTVYLDGRSVNYYADLVNCTLKHVLNEKCDVFMASLEDLFLITSEIKEYSVPENWPAICTLGGRSLYESNVDILKRFFKIIYNRYVCSEAINISVKKITENTAFEDFNSGTPVTSCGIIIRDENNALLSNGKSGNLYIKTKSMFKRYFDDEELTKSAVDEAGYFNTTDMGYFKSHGEIIVFGRRKDVIARSEDYFHPVWIEKVIKTCPEVKDVMVVKVPDVKKGNEICACVVLVSGSNYTARMIEDFCRNAFMEEDYEHVTACPKYFVIFDKIPLNRNKKPDRNVAERHATEMLSL